MQRINKKKKRKRGDNMEYKRIFLIVMDSVGIGNAKDADKFHDKGANTLEHII